MIYTASLCCCIAYALIYSLARDWLIANPAATRVLIDYHFTEELQCSPS